MQLSPRPPTSFKTFPVELLRMIFAYIAAPDLEDPEWYCILTDSGEEGLNVEGTLPRSRRHYRRPPPNPKEYPHWIDITYVCRSWRTIAESYPDLWTCLDFYNPRWIARFLRLSQGRRLSVFFNLGYHNIEHGPKQLELLVPHYHRIQHLCVMARKTSCWPDSPLINGYDWDAFSVLETFNFIPCLGPYDTVASFNNILPIQSPSLRILRVYDPQLRLTSPESLVAFPNLTHLIIHHWNEFGGRAHQRPNVHNILALLERLPTLEVLVLSEDDPCMDGSRPLAPPSQIIHLPCLRRMTICWSDAPILLQCLSWPSSAYMRIHCGIMGEENTNLGHVIIPNEFVSQLTSNIPIDTDTPIRSLVCHSTQHVFAYVGSPSPLPDDRPAQFILKFIGVFFTNDAALVAGRRLPLSDVLSVKISAESLRHAEAGWLGFLRRMPHLQHLIIQENVEYKSYANCEGIICFRGDWNVAPCLSIPGLQSLTLKNPQVPREFWTELEDVLGARRAAGGKLLVVRVEDALPGKMAGDPAFDRLKEAGLHAAVTYVFGDSRYCRAYGSRLLVLHPALGIEKAVCMYRVQWLCSNYLCFVINLGSCDIFLDRTALTVNLASEYTLVTALQFFYSASGDSKWPLRRLSSSSKPVPLHATSVAISKGLEMAICEDADHVQTAKASGSHRASLLLGDFPPELLQMIFKVLAGPEWYNDIISERGYDRRNDLPLLRSGLKSCPEWVSVTHVCRSWRSIAIRYPDLWTSLDFLNPRWTELFLQLSAQMPLYLVYDVTKDWNTRTSGPDGGRKQALSPHLHRVRHLCVVARKDSSWANFPKIDGWGGPACPGLQTINFVAIFGSAAALTLPNNLTPGQMSGLRVLRISTHQLRARFGAPAAFPNLTHLVVRGWVREVRRPPPHATFYQGIYALLEKTPRLEVLVLEDDASTMKDVIPKTRPSEADIIRLPHLHTLVLSWSDAPVLLQRLAYPPSAALHILGVVQSASSGSGGPEVAIASAFVAHLASYLHDDPGARMPVRFLRCETTHRLTIAAVPGDGDAPPRFSLDLLGLRFPEDVGGAAAECLRLADILTAEFAAESFKHAECGWAGVLRCLPRLRHLVVRQNRDGAADDVPNDSFDAEADDDTEVEVGAEAMAMAKADEGRGQTVKFTSLAVLKVLGRSASRGAWDAPPCVPGLRTLTLRNPRISRRFWIRLEKILSARWMAGGGTVVVRLEDVLACKIDDSRALERLMEAGLVSISYREGAASASAGEA
ncbi:hypothetical protein EVG20_g2180 [Dentipellis fragilis]|uniref:Uncharacterized protein n=1 Tax=Dentipellis fragilis TaxID=205917 RepID=A0A4Y9ZAH2_9AGAM|nr:hypothetical protein EVG20_g2180 [Dentipellis fragilis]